MEEDEFIIVDKIQEVIQETIQIKEDIIEENIKDSPIELNNLAETMIKNDEENNKINKVIIDNYYKIKKDNDDNNIYEGYIIFGLVIILLLYNLL